MPHPPASNRRVLVVDDDAAVREELRARLLAAGYDAEGVSMAAGFTPEFLVRLAPGLVLVDRSTSAPVVRSVVASLRKHLRTRLLVMGPAGPSLDQFAREVGADGAVDKARLRIDPAGSLAGRPPPLPPRPKPPPEILSMIEEELARLQAEESIEAPPVYTVAVDLFSEHNFYLTKTPTGRLVGLFVATSMPPPVGTLVGLSVALLGGHRFTTRGEVAWVHERFGEAVPSRLPPGAGIRLLDLTDEDKQAIRRFLSQRTPYATAGG